VGTEWPADKRVTRYPWDDLTDGNIWILEKGQDFENDPRSMRSTVNSYARRHDIAVRTKIPRPSGPRSRRPREIFVQFFPGVPYGGATTPTQDESASRQERRKK
jgi:hypothetical protein